MSKGPLVRGRDVIEQAPPVVRSARSVRAIERGAAVLSGRWKVAVLWLLTSGCRHYSQLAARLPGISPKVLAQQLRELERDGLITRHETRGGRRRVKYELTALGEALRPLLEELERWGHECARA